MSFQSVFAVLAVVAIWCFLSIIRSWYSGDLSPVATVDWEQLATGSALCPIVLLFFTRFVSQITIFSTCWVIASGPKGKSAPSITYEGRTVILVGWTRFTTFTVWSWTLQLVYFTTTTFITGVWWLGGAAGQTWVQSLPRWIHTTTWILYEISLPVSLLVFLIVWLVLIPLARRSGMNMDVLFSLPALVMHNGNLVFMLIELVINALPVTWHHYPFVLLYGIAYCCFAALWHWHTGVYYYFFLDYRRKFALYCYVGLLMVISLFWTGGWLLSSKIMVKVV